MKALPLAVGGTNSEPPRQEKSRAFSVASTECRGLEAGSRPLTLPHSCFLSVPFNPELPKLDSFT